MLLTVCRIELTEVNLLDDAWPEAVTRVPDAVVTSWALHDLGGREATFAVYERVARLLKR